MVLNQIFSYNFNYILKKYEKYKKCFQKFQQIKLTTN